MFLSKRTLLRTLERERHAATEERRELIDALTEMADRVMFLAGKPWTPPPAHESTPRDPADDYELDLIDPDQLP